MASASPLAPWAVPPGSTPATEDGAFLRLWRGFMAARIAIGIALAASLGALALIAPHASASGWTFGLCLAYLGAAVAVRRLARPAGGGHVFDPHWVSTIGIDLLAFSALQFLQPGGLNFAPLFTLPVLTGAVLGSTLLALGTAAGVTLILLGDAWVLALAQPTDYAQRFLQAALAGTGYFALAVLANQLGTRLAREESTARRSLLAARAQEHVNELVIETLSQGVLVIDAAGLVHAANPAARELLGWTAAAPHLPLDLGTVGGGEPLASLTRATFDAGSPQHADIALVHPGGERRLVQVHTRLTPPHERQGPGLCVMFLQDLREMEARLRTEKLAAMGRMSTAVAHEFRNPLAAIAQANELLGEELSEPSQRQLSALVHQNTLRLSRIVDDILDIARVQHNPSRDARLPLDEAAAAVCREWSEHMRVGGRLHTDFAASDAVVVFDADHLRRVLVNLLDNALRYATTAPGAIRVWTDAQTLHAPTLHVWSDGPPLEQGVQRHLFEPFFSSESRSSGLGLYICRELCERHEASITYCRASAPGSPREGNDFSVTFQGAASRARSVAFATMAR